MEWVFHKWKVDDSGNKLYATKYIRDSNTIANNNGWLLYVDNYEQLEHYSIYCVLPELRRVWNTISDKFEGKRSWTDHIMSHLEHIGVLCAMELENQNIQCDYFTWLFSTSLRIMKPFDSYLKADGCVYISPIFQALQKSHLEKYAHRTNDDPQIIPTIKNGWAYDETNELRIFSWKNGKHYYAKYRNMDVVDSNGEQKWNTKIEAYNASLEYINKNKKSYA